MPTLFRKVQDQAASRRSLALGTIFIPWHFNQVPAAQERAMTITYPTVLIVEDEPIVRMYEAELAEGAGFVTLQAKNAEEALNKLDGAEPIHILLTDVNMPGGVDGLTLANIVRERWPEIKVVVVSAHVDSHEPEPPRGIAYLHKPFTHQELIGALLSVV
jgi:CheY-like chemotaxis protein